MEKSVVDKAVKLFDEKYPLLKSKKQLCFNFNGKPTILIDHDPKRIGENIFFAVDIGQNKVIPFCANPDVVERLSSYDWKAESVNLR